MAPEYAYQCPRCEFRNLFTHGANDEPILDCPTCGEILTRDFKAAMPVLLRSRRERVEADVAEAKRCGHLGSCGCAWDLF
jgi:transcription initiation factor IIE alpha subunit